MLQRPRPNGNLSLGKDHIKTHLDDPDVMDVMDVMDAMDVMGAVEKMDVMDVRPWPKVWNHVKNILIWCIKNVIFSSYKYVNSWYVFWDCQSLLVSGLALRHKAFLSISE